MKEYFSTQAYKKAPNFLNRKWVLFLYKFDNVTDIAIQRITERI